MTSSAESIDFWMVCAAIGKLVAAYLSMAVMLTVLNAAWTLLKNLGHLSMRFAAIAGEALGVAAAWPFELALDQSEKWLAVAVEWRAQRKIWRAEFRTKMSWDEFRRQMSGQQKPQRDEYADALSVLGLAEPFTQREVDTRFRRLMQGVHPDTGGSENLSKQVTTARTLVLKRKGWKR
jgi:hypothetical protein